MTIAERKRQLVRDELTEAALRLLAFQGFEETTIDQMVAAAGVSRRTFFRYFRSKEDVIIEFLGDLGRTLRAGLAGRPANEGPAAAVRTTLTLFTDKFREHPEKSLRLTKIILSTPAILARYLERQVEWRASLTTELGERMGVDPATDLRPALVVAIAFAALDTALTTWAHRDGTDDLSDLVGAAFALVESGIFTA